MRLDPVRATCCSCGERRLELLIAIDVQGFPHGQPGHTTVYSQHAVFVCRQCGYAQLELYSHDCWNYYADEPWDMYWWYMLDPANLLELRAVIAACTRAWDAACGCELHRALLSACERLYGKIRHSLVPDAALDAPHIAFVHDGEQLSFVIR